MFSAILCLSLLLLAGCTTLESSLERRIELFEQTTFLFEHAIRWGDYELANDFIHSDDGGESAPDFGKLRGLRVSSYELLKSTISADEMQARQTVEIKYYYVNSLVEKSLVHDQLWIYDPMEKKWYLKGTFPDFK